MGKFAVVLDSPEPLEGWDKQAEELARITGKTQYDVTRILRNGRGIFEPFEAVEAERAVSIFARMGREGRVVEASRIPSLDPVYTIRNADCTPEGLMIQVGYTPKMKALPWPEVRLIGACIVRRTTTRKSAGMGSFRREVSFGPRGMRTTRKRRETQRREESREEVCDVFTLDPVLHIRMNGRGFNYDYLADRLVTSASENFLLLISDLVRMSPAARLAADASFFAEGTPPPEIRELAEFDAINRHALTLLLLGQ